MSLKNLGYWVLFSPWRWLRNIDFFLSSCYCPWQWLQIIEAFLSSFHNSFQYSQYMYCLLMSLVPCNPIMLLSCHTWCCTFPCCVHLVTFVYAVNIFVLMLENRYVTSTVLSIIFEDLRPWPYHTALGLLSYLYIFCLIKIGINKIMTFIHSPLCHSFVMPVGTFFTCYYICRQEIFNYTYFRIFWSFLISNNRSKNGHTWEDNNSPLMRLMKLIRGWQMYTRVTSWPANGFLNSRFWLSDYLLDMYQNRYTAS